MGHDWVHTTTAPNGYAGVSVVQTVSSSMSTSDTRSSS
jgi:hypothetical protein